MNNPERIIVTDTEVIITGCPDCDDEAHNCDLMGCGSCEHILVRCKRVHSLIGFDTEQGEKP